MVPEEPMRRVRRKKLGRGLSDISHVFLSGAERPGKVEGCDEDPRLWSSDVEIISVTSGDGVRGKTFLAASVAFGLAARGYRTAIVNSDGARPGVLDVTGAAPEDCDSGELMSNEAFGALPEGDLAVEPGEIGPASPVFRSLAGSLNRLTARVERVVVDTSPSARQATAIWKSAKLVLVVTEPSQDAMKSSYVAIKRVRGASEARIGLVVNLARDRDEAGRCFRKMSNVCRRFLKTNLRDYGYIVRGEAVGESLARAVPVACGYPDSKITGCVDNIVKLIIMDHMAIARRRREVAAGTCASRDRR
jgi:MinD-like ATPase involved in chromosome partitioning or flagellar assembly